MRLNKYLLSAACIVGLTLGELNAEAVLATYKGKPIVHKTEFDKLVKEFGLASIPLEQYYLKLLMDIMARNILDAEMGQSDMKKDPDFKAASEAAAKRFEREYFMRYTAKKMITPDMKNRLYDQIKAAYKGRYEVKPHIIILPTEAVAKEVHNKIKNGGNFAELAKAHSMDPSKENGGDIKDFVPEEVFSPEIVKYFSSGSETPSAPIKFEIGTENGTMVKYAIVKLMKKDRRELVVPPKDSPQISQAIENEAVNLLVQQIQAGYLKQAKIFDVNGKEINGIQNEGQQQPPQGIPLINSK